MKKLASIIFSLLLIAAPAWAVVLVTEPFTGSDANPIGGNWTTVTASHDLQRVGNRVRNSGTAGPAAAYHNAITPPDDQWAQITLTTMVSGMAPCIVTRVSTTAEDYYAVCPQGGFLDIHKRIAGVKTDLSANFETFAAGNTLMVESQGTDLRAFINGANVENNSDGSLTSGRFGILIFASASTADIEGDDFIGGDFTSTAGAVRRRVIVVD